MSKLDTKKMIDHIKDKWGESPCPMCGAKDWGVPDSIFEMREFHKEGLVLGGSLIPLVPVVCGNCGNTVLVSSLVAGITKSDKG